jgi:hypothetical protein
MISTNDAEEIAAQGRRTFACLHGLIQAVEREAGKLSKLAATITSLLVLAVARTSSSTSFPV